MAKESNYVLKITLTEADTLRDALVAYHYQLEETAQRLIARREPVSLPVTEQLDACARLLARI